MLSKALNRKRMPAMPVGFTLATFTTADFSGSGVCAFCHSQLVDSAGNDVSIDSHWRSTMMANAARDPLWQAKISSEVDRNPSLQAAIEEKCSRCHMGMARYQAITDGEAVAVLGTGFLDPNHRLNSAAMDGVSCTLCHQIQESGLGSSETFTGQYRIDTTTSPPDRLTFGPYQSPFQNPMRKHSGFTPIYGTHVAGSAYCASCHMLFTPTVDAQGNVLGEFPEQMTYLEWEFSGGMNGPGCQDCHTSGLAIVSLYRDQATNHLMFTVKVQNLTGHKLPTGIPIRRLWLHVTVKDKNGVVVFESGKPLAGGSISGNNADLNAFDYEPHHDLIKDPNQVQIYETVMLDSGGYPTQTLLRAATYAKDNRLLPVGFDKNSAPAGIGVVGLASTDANFSGGQDQVTYEVIAPAGRMSVTAELLYQSVSYSFVEDLRQSNLSLVERFIGMYDISDKTPMVIASVQASIR